MQYKTIILELLQQRPQMHEQLRKERKLLPTMERYARELKDQPPGVEGTAPGAAAGQRPEPDRERSPGDGAQGTGGSFAARVSGERRPAPSTQQWHPSGVIRRARKETTAASRYSISMPLLLPAAPPGAINDGTVINPPGRASGQSVPPEGLPQFSAGPVASQAQPRPGVDSSSRRQAPDAGPPTQGGDQVMPSTQLALTFHRRQARLPQRPS